MSDLALKLIEENKKTRSTFLDLGNCGLTGIPQELAELEWLEELTFASDWSDFDGKEWKEYKTQNTGHRNKIDSLCSAIPVFSRLVKLKKLWLNGEFGKHFDFDDLSPLAGLTGLRQLDVSDTRVSDLSPLAGLTGLQQLVVSYTPVSDLSPLSRLTGLQLLVVSDTLINDLFPILNLIANGIPVSLSDEWWKGEGVYLKDCPLTNPPAEIVEQGNAAILNYFREKEAQGVDRLYEDKLLIIGEGGAGKISLLRRLYRPEEPLPEENESTQGIEIYRQDFTLKNGRIFRLNVWDFGGQEIYHATHQLVGYASRTLGY
ncbi:MAG: hypothetical protein ACU83N_11125 [Gammaproteobacteria bacterium]